MEAYGSAVCGLAISGLRGLRTGPDIRELPFVVEESVDTLDAVDVTLLSGRSFEGPLLCARNSGLGLDGDIVAIAELGRSGRFLAALFARLCSAINSFNVDRPPGRDAPDIELVEPPCSAALGLFESFSKSARDLGSSLSIIAFAFSVQVFAKVQ